MKKFENYWRLKFWRVPNLDSLELLHGSGINYHYPRHMHDKYSIVLMLGGTETTTIRGTSYTAFPGQLLLINADEVHSSSSIQTEYRIFKVGANVLSQVALELCGHQLEKPYFPKPITEDAPVFRALLDLHLELETSASTLEQESKFISTMAILLSRHSQVKSILQPTYNEPRYVKIIRDYLKSHYAENISLSKLTSITNLSPFHLLRVFKKQVGCPPHEYQTQLRIAHARRLIRDGNSILNVALETGFADQSHFSRNFKRIVGIPPGQYSHSKIIQDRNDRLC